MIDISILKTLEPISALSLNRMQELASLCFIEKVSKGLDPFRMNVVKNAQAMYLLKGNLRLIFKDGHEEVMSANSNVARRPLDPVKLGTKDSFALTEIEILRVDTDLLDILMTWDQLATVRIDRKHSAIVSNENEKYSFNEWMNEANAFSVSKLYGGIFDRLPPANIEEMFRRMTLIKVKAGQVIVKQGDEGDYYYLIESGCAIVSKANSLCGTVSILTELISGEAFGEEALVSENKRNATITMKSDGNLLQLNKIDFIDLLKEPLITELTFEGAQLKLKQECAQWLDIRSPSEYKIDHLPNAINLPLNQIRLQVGILSKNRSYIAYCQSGRRSSVAVFLLAIQGYRIGVLKGGLRAIKDD